MPNATAAPYVRRHLGSHCWSPYVTVEHASSGLGRYQQPLLVSRRLRSQSKVKQRLSIDTETLDGGFAFTFALIVERPCIGRPMADRIHILLRWARLLIRISLRHRYPYSKRRNTPGCSFQPALNNFGAQLPATARSAFHHARALAIGSFRPHPGRSATYVR